MRVFFAPAVGPADERELVPQADCKVLAPGEPRRFSSQPKAKSVDLAKLPVKSSVGDSPFTPEDRRQLQQAARSIRAKRGAA